jgi:putative ABC transport system permease protein
MFNDFRDAFRTLRHNLTFTAVVVFALALGIGANTTVFTLINAVILRRLPVADPEELVWFRDPSFSYPIFEQVRARGGDAFSSVFAWDMQRFNVGWGKGTESVQALVVSGEFHTTLGVKALSGRLLTVEDDWGKGVQGPVAVVSQACWQRRFDADPAVVGRTIHIERIPFTIVGVTPPEFFGVAPGAAPEITIPVTTLPLVRPQEGNILRAPTSAWLHLMARLKPGLTLQQADAALQTWWPQVMESTINPGMPQDRQLRYLSRKTGLASGHNGFSSVRNQFAEPLWMLLALVSLLLLVACATVANLLLARFAARQREVAVRLAIGGGRWRITRQFLAESLLLAVAAAGFGLIFALWIGPLVVRFFSTTYTQIVLDLRPDWRVLTYTTAAALVTALVFGLAPALRATGIDPGPVLKESAQIIGRGPQRWRLGKALAIFQMALSLLLLIGTALFVRSLHRLLTLDPGFQRENVLLVSVDVLSIGHGTARLASFYQQVLNEIRTLPGVLSASLSWVPPISNNLGSWTQSVGVDNRPSQEEQTHTYFNAVSARFFGTLGIPITSGRDFSEHDSPSSPRVVIINESLARSFFPNQDPLGHRISIGKHEARQALEIVGVVRDSKYQRLQEPSRRIAYLPYLQLPEFLAGSNLMAVVRTAIPPKGVAESIRQKLLSIEPALPVRFETLAGRIEESLVRERVMAWISGFLGLLALVLASGSLYGLMAHMVANRKNEIGLRVALGARPNRVLWMVMWETLQLAGVGLLIGLAASVGLSRFVAHLLFGVTATDPIAFSGAIVLMVIVAALAGYLPARRAASVDPVVALRCE